MQINYNPSVHKAYSQNAGNNSKVGQEAKDEKKAGFEKTVNEYLQNVDNDQKQSDASIQDLLTGKNQDINSVVASVAKADSSFNLLVGVRNKLIEAYKETMRMQI